MSACVPLRRRVPLEPGASVLVLGATGNDRLYRGDTINAPALTAMLKQIIANNRGGGWRKLKARNTAR